MGGFEKKNELKTGKNGWDGIKKWGEGKRKNIKRNVIG